MTKANINIISIFVKQIFIVMTFAKWTEKLNGQKVDIVCGGKGRIEFNFLVGICREKSLVRLSMGNLFRRIEKSTDSKTKEKQINFQGRTSIRSPF